MSKVNNYKPLDKFFGKNGAEASNKLKKQYWKQISETITKHLIWKNKIININWQEFNLYENIETLEWAKKIIQKIELLLSSQVWAYLDENTKILLLSHKNGLQKEIDQLWDEYNLKNTLPPDEFLKQTTNINFLKDYLKAIDEIWDLNEAQWLKELAEQRLKELEKEQNKKSE